MVDVEICMFMYIKTEVYKDSILNKINLSTNNCTKLRTVQITVE